MKKSEVEFGSVHGKLTLLALCRVMGNTKYGIVNALCICECGKAVKASLYDLGKRINSCGCLKKAENHHSYTHGATRSPAWRSWSAMWSRCTNKNQERYEAYKDKCPPDRWKSFENFLEDMGERPEGCTLDRIKVELPYGPTNCRWATGKTQARNRTDTVYIKYKGSEIALADFCEQEGVAYSKAYYRIIRCGEDVSLFLESIKNQKLP